MSVQGYTREAIVAAYARSVSVEYTYGELQIYCGTFSIEAKASQVAAITIVIYDSLILFHREVRIFQKPLICLRLIFSVFQARLCL